MHVETNSVVIDAGLFVSRSFVYCIAFFLPMQFCHFEFPGKHVFVDKHTIGARGLSCSDLSATCFVIGSVYGF